MKKKKTPRVVECSHSVILPSFKSRVSFASGVHRLGSVGAEDKGTSPGGEVTLREDQRGQITFRGVLWTTAAAFVSLSGRFFGIARHFS